MGPAQLIPLDAAIRPSIATRRPSLPAPAPRVNRPVRDRDARGRRSNGSQGVELTVPLRGRPIADRGRWRRSEQVEEGVMAADPGKLEAFVGKMAGDMGAAMSASLVQLGDRLGLYKAMAEAGPSTSAALAAHAGVNERNLREWLSAQAASGYVDYDAATAKFSLNNEQAMVFADEGGPAFMAGGFDLIAAMFIDEPNVAEAFNG
jgi:hypothetical protein